MDQESDSTVGVLHESVHARRKLEDARQFFHNGDCLAARDACRELLKQHTEYVGAMMLLGQVYVALRDYNAALPCFDRAAMLSPYDPSICVQLAQNYFYLSAWDAALQTAEIALSLEPDEALAGEVHLLLGRIHEQRAEYELAGEYLEKASLLNTEQNDAALLHVRCLLKLGERDGAAALLASIPDGDVSLMDRSWIVHNLAGHPAFGAPKDVLAQIDELSRQRSVIGDDKQRTIFHARLELARASVLEAQEKHDAAWEALKSGNTPMHKLYAADCAKRRDQHSHTLKRAAGWNYTGAAAIPHGFNPPQSLFLLGPSQTGKNLLEWLIGTMEGSSLGHESNIVYAATARTCNVEGLMTLRFPGQLPRAIHKTFTETYIDELSLRAPKAKLYTITHPEMIMDLGLIAETVPRMRVVFIDRDTDDTALRIFGNVYDGDTSCYAYDIASIYEYIEGYRKLISAWADHLPRLSMQVTYEDVLSDPKKVLSQIAEFCDLPSPEGELPRLADDRRCAEPYRAYLNRVKNSSRADNDVQFAS